MYDTKEEILLEIDTTLDQLLTNASMIDELVADPHFCIEIDALEKAQESLLSHLMHMDQFLAGKMRPDELKEKTLQLSQMKSLRKKRIRSQETPSPRINRRKKKLFSN